MPTTGRLAGAILFGVLAWISTLWIVPQFPPDTDLQALYLINAASGVYVGWFVAGPRVGGGLVSAISFGATSMVAMVIVALGANAFIVMFKRSLDGRHNDPIDALTDIFVLFLRYAKMAAQPEIIATLVVGSLVAGVLTEAIGRRYG